MLALTIVNASAVNVPEVRVNRMAVAETIVPYPNLSKIPVELAEPAPLLKAIVTFGLMNQKKTIV